MCKEAGWNVKQIGKHIKMKYRKNLMLVTASVALLGVALSIPEAAWAWNGWGSSGKPLVV